MELHRAAAKRRYRPKWLRLEYRLALHPRERIHTEQIMKLDECDG
jgi:hypothetical protein